MEGPSGSTTYSLPFGDGDRTRTPLINAGYVWSDLMGGKVCEGEIRLPQAEGRVYYEKDVVGPAGLEPATLSLEG